MFTRPRQQSIAGVPGPGGPGVPSSAAAPNGAAGGGGYGAVQQAGNSNGNHQQFYGQVYQQQPSPQQFQQQQFNNYAAVPNNGNFGYAQQQQPPPLQQQQQFHYNQQFAQQQIPQQQFQQQQQQQPQQPLGAHAPIERQSSFTGLPPVRRTSTLHFDMASLIGDEKGKLPEDQSHQQQPQSNDVQQQGGFFPAQFQQQSPPQQQQPFNPPVQQQAQSLHPGPGPASQQRTPSWGVQSQQQPQPQPQQQQQQLQQQLGGPQNPLQSHPVSAHQSLSSQQQQAQPLQGGFAQQQVPLQQGQGFGQYQNQIQNQSQNQAPQQPVQQGFAVQPGPAYNQLPSQQQQQQQQQSTQNSNPLQRFLPKAGWNLQESHLQEPLASTRHRTSPTGAPDQQQSYSFDKETGLPSAEAALTRQSTMGTGTDTWGASSSGSMQPLSQQMTQGQQVPQQQVHQQQLQLQQQQPLQQQPQLQQQLQQQQPPMQSGPAVPGHFYTQNGQQQGQLQAQPQPQPQPQAQPQGPPQSQLRSVPAGAAAADDKGRRFSKISSWRMSTPPTSSHSTKGPQQQQQQKEQAPPGSSASNLSHVHTQAQVEQAPKQFNPQGMQMQPQSFQNMQQQQQPPPQQQFHQQTQQQPPPQQQQQQQTPQLQAAGKKIRNLLPFGKGSKGQSQSQDHTQLQQQPQQPQLFQGQGRPLSTIYQYQQQPQQGFQGPHQQQLQLQLQLQPQQFQQSQPGFQQSQQGPPQNFQGPPPQQGLQSNVGIAGAAPQSFQGPPGAASVYQVSPQSRHGTPQNFPSAQQGFQRPPPQQPSVAQPISQSTSPAPQVNQQQVPPPTMTTTTSSSPAQTRAETATTLPPQSFSPQSQGNSITQSPEQLKGPLAQESATQSAAPVAQSPAPALNQPETAPVSPPAPASASPLQQTQSPVTVPATVQPSNTTSPVQHQSPPPANSQPRSLQPQEQQGGAPATGEGVGPFPNQASNGQVPHPNGQVAPANTFEQQGRVQSFGPGGPMQGSQPQQFLPQQFPQQQQQLNQPNQPFQQQPYFQQQAQLQQQQQQQGAPLTKYETQGAPPMPDNFFSRTHTFGSIVPSEANSNRRASGLLSGIMGKVRGKDKNKIDTTNISTPVPAPGPGPQYPQGSIGSAGITPSSTFGSLQHSQTGLSQTHSLPSQQHQFQPRPTFSSPSTPVGGGAVLGPFARPRTLSNTPSLVQLRQQSPQPNAANSPQPPSGVPAPSPSPLSINTNRPPQPLGGPTQSQSSAMAGTPGSASVGPGSATTLRGAASPATPAGGVGAPLNRETSAQQTFYPASGPGSGTSTGAAVSSPATASPLGRASIDAASPGFVGPVPTARGRLPSASAPSVPSPLARKPVASKTPSPLQQPSATAPPAQPDSQTPAGGVATAPAAAAQGQETAPLRRPPGIGHTIERPASTVSVLTINAAADNGGKPLTEVTPATSTTSPQRSGSPTVSMVSVQPPVSSAGATISPTPPPQQGQFHGGPYPGQPNQQLANVVKAVAFSDQHQGPANNSQGAAGAQGQVSRTEKEMERAKKFFGRFLNRGGGGGGNGGTASNGAAKNGTADPEGPPPGGPQYPLGHAPPSLRHRHASSVDNTLTGPPPGGPVRPSMQMERPPQGQFGPQGRQGLIGQPSPQGQPGQPIQQGQQPMQLMQQGRPMGYGGPGVRMTGSPQGGAQPGAQPGGQSGAQPGTQPGPMLNGAAAAPAPSVPNVGSGQQPANALPKPVEPPQAGNVPQPPAQATQPTDAAIQKAGAPQQQPNGQVSGQASGQASGPQQKPPVTGLQGPHRMYQDQRLSQFPSQVMPNSIPDSNNARSGATSPASARKQALQQQISPNEVRQQQLPLQSQGAFPQHQQHQQGPPNQQFQQVPPQQQVSQQQQKPAGQHSTFGSLFRPKPAQSQQQPQQQVPRQQIPQQQIPQQQHHHHHHFPHLMHQQQQQLQKQPNQSYQEPQYGAVPIPQGYAAVHGEGLVAPSQYNLGRQQQQQPPHGQFQQYQQFQAPRQQQFLPQPLPQQQFQQNQQWSAAGGQPQQGQPQQFVQQNQGQAPGQAQVPLGAFVQANAAPAAVQGVPQPAPQAPQGSQNQGPPRSSAGPTGQSEGAAHPLQQHPVAYTVPPPPPATSSFSVEEDSIVTDTVPAALHSTPAPPPPTQQQEEVKEEQEESAATPLPQGTGNSAQAANAETPVSSLHASPQPGQVQLSEGSAIADHADLGREISQEISLTTSNTSSEKASPPTEPSIIVADAVPAPLIVHSTGTHSPTESQPLQQQVSVQVSEPVYAAAPATATATATAEAKDMPLTNGALAASKAAQLTPIATVAANQHVPGDDEDIYNATPLHPSKASEDQTILDDPPASLVDRAAPTVAPLVVESVAVEPPVTKAVESEEPVAAAPAAATTKPEAAGPPTLDTTVSPAVAGVTSPIARIGSAEPDISNITPPSPVDDMDFTEFGFPSGAKLSATGGLTLPYASSGGPSDSQSNGTAADGTDVVSRQKTIRQTSAQQFEDYKRRLMLKDLEEKIPVFIPEPDDDLAAQKQKEQEEPTMSATSYPGQEWNPYDEFAYVDDE
ncbi:hypothetical protein SCUCBS95973_003837 [Sporothrix curviconia]|uniref:Uncharacterized protein n=1 Tax=Sporothrix curviconia TaxID=1260050 RepID=A0ABP0BJ05_9PEZI